jgi:hypothetical protein
VSAARLNSLTHVRLAILPLVVVLSIAAAAVSTDAQRPTAGRAQISLNGAGVSLAGDYPTTLCGGPYMLGSGLAYQTKAGDWQITVASENRASGKVPLNESGGVNVVVTINGPGRNYVRYPENGGSLTVSADFKKAEAALDLRSPVGKDTAKLVATFTCQ